MFLISEIWNYPFIIGKMSSASANLVLGEISVPCSSICSHKVPITSILPPLSSTLQTDW